VAGAATWMTIATIGGRKAAMYQQGADRFRRFRRFKALRLGKCHREIVAD